jgi:hypothetical protein
VELNAMTAPVFIDFLERKLAEQGVRKIMPEREILELHARRVIEQRLVDKVLRENRSTVQAEAASVALPDDLDGRVRAILATQPELSWDDAVSVLVQGAAA